MPYSESTSPFSEASCRTAKLLGSDHEGQVDVLDTVANVDGAVDSRVGSVVAVVAGPELTSESGHGLRGVLDNAP